QIKEENNASYQEVLNPYNRKKTSYLSGKKKLVIRKHPFLNHLPRIPNHSRSIRHIPDNHRTCAYPAPATYFYSGNDTGSNSNMSSFSDFYITCQSYIRRNMNIVMKNAVVIHGSIGIDNHMPSDFDVGIHRHPCHNNRSASYLCSLRHNRFGVN